MAVPEGLIAIVWTVLCAVLAPAVLGAGLVRWCGLLPQAGLRVFAAWSYLVGQLAQAPVTYLWLARGQPLPGYCLPLFAAMAGALLLVAHRGRTMVLTDRVRGDPWLAGLCVVLVLLFVDQCLLIGTQPILSGDDAGIWSAKAKALYTAPGFDLGLPLTYVGHADYPLLNPLVQVLGFASNARVLQFENRLPIQAFGVALLLLLSAATERRSNRWIAAAALVAFSASSFSWCATSAFADVMTAVGLFAAVDAWLRWSETGERVWWRLCCIGLAVALASKNEGAMLCAVAAGAVLVSTLLQRPRPCVRLDRGVLWLGVPAAILGAQWVFNAHFHLACDLFDPAWTEGRGLFGQIAHWLPVRAPIVLEHYGRQLLDGPSGRWLVLLLLGSAVLRGRRLLHGREALPLLLVVFALVGYMLVFVGTCANLGGADGPTQGLLWHLGTAADRTVLHVLPVAVLGLCMQLGGPTPAPRRD